MGGRRLLNQVPDGRCRHRTDSWVLGADRRDSPCVEKPEALGAGNRCRPERAASFTAALAAGKPFPFAMHRPSQMVERADSGGERLWHWPAGW